MAAHAEPMNLTRRALIAGALGGLAGWAAGLAGRVAPVVATDGQAVLQGVDNGGATATLIRTSGGTAFQGLADALTGETYGVRGRNSSTEGGGVVGSATATSGFIAGVLGVTNSPAGSGVKGVSAPTGTRGVWGHSEQGAGVLGTSGSWHGIEGNSSSDAGVYGSSLAYRGVFGDSPQGVGVYGAGGAAGIEGAGGIRGVYGHSTSGIGVAGTSGSSYGLVGTSTTGRGVHGFSPSGHGVHGASDTGWAGYFEGRVLTQRYHELVEIGTPSAPGKNHARLFVRDNGSGKTQLCVRFATGSVRVLATQG